MTGILVVQRIDAIISTPRWSRVSITTSRRGDWITGGFFIPYRILSCRVRQMTHWSPVRPMMNPRERDDHLSPVGDDSLPFSFNSRFENTDAKCHFFDLFSDWLEIKFWMKLWWTLTRERPKCHLHLLFLSLSLWRSRWSREKAIKFTNLFQSLLNWMVIFQILL